MADPHHVVILGGGFAGLSAARSLYRSRFRVTLVDRRNFHLFQPLLYQVATGGLSPANIAAPLRTVVRRQRNVRVILGEAESIDVKNRRVLLKEGDLRYDSLIVATGVTNNYFGHPEWAEHAPGLKSIEDATHIRGRILQAFEKAERATDPDEIRSLLTFVVVGGGPTGVELAGAIAEIARYTLRYEFRSIRPGDAKVILVEGGPVVLGTFAPDLSAKAAFSLGRLGVQLRMNSFVTGVDEEGVRLGEDRIEARTVIWAAGVKASPLGAATGGELDRAGRVLVNEELNLPGHPEIFVLGDLANRDNLPGVAPVAMQQGRYVGDLLQRRQAGRKTKPFRYKDKGNLATIGRRAAVAQIGGLKMSGFAAWMMWLLIHLMYLVMFESRILVLTQWAWNYFTYSRSARLITK